VSRLAQQWAATAVPETEPEPVAEEDSGELFPFEIGSFAYRNGSITYRDAVPQTPFTTTLGPINIGIDNFSTREIEQPGIKNLVMQLEQGATLTWHSDCVVSPLQCSGQLELADFSRTTPYRYSQDALPVALNSGTVSAQVDYRFSLED